MRSYRADPAVPDFPDDKPIIVFDGECVFCSGWVGFALKVDRKKRYRFVTAQSDLGMALYRHYGLVYEFVARNRFRIAGRKESFFVPSASDKARLLA